MTLLNKIPFLSTLIVALAHAQGPPAAPLQCTAASPKPGTARIEASSELLSDIVITCTGGQVLPAGAAIPTVNITVSMGVNVTSRIVAYPNISEAALLIDEPGAGGSSAAQNICSNFVVGSSRGGCVQYAFPSAKGVPAASSAPDSLTPPVNVFFGAVNANQVFFTGIPLLPPAIAGAARVFRITNLRANVIGLSGIQSNLAVLAAVSVEPNFAMPISNPVQLLSFFQFGMRTAVRNAANTGPLNTSGGAMLSSLTAEPAPVTTLQFSETFANAFKTRVAPTGNYNGQAGPSTVNQRVPGIVYNSESGFVFTGQGVFNGNHPGLADYGTRLKAAFQNVPAGVRLFVSVTNLASNTSSPNMPNTSTSYAQLVRGEADRDGDGTAPVVAATISVNAQSTDLAEIPVAGGVAMAVWEIIKADPAAVETFHFGVWAIYSSTEGAGSGSATITLGFAPAPPIAFDYAASSHASDSLPLPRFVDTSVPSTVLSVGTSACLYAVSTAFRAFGAAGGSHTITLETGAQCSWWVSNSATWIHPATFAGVGPGTFGYSVDANPASDSRGIVMWVAGQAVNVTQAGTDAPAISFRGIVDSWNHTQGVSPGAWVSIYGLNFATSAETWQPQPNAPLKTVLGGVTVWIDGIAAPLQYVGPSRIDALVPASVHEDQQVLVVVSRNGVESAPFPVMSHRFLPAIYGIAPYSITNVFTRVDVTAVDPSTGQLLGRAAADPRVSRAVRPGDTIDVYAIGLGPTIPAFPTDSLFTGGYAVASPFTVRLGSASIVPAFATLIGPGLYQVRITIPAGMPYGDHPIQFDFGKAQSAQGVYLTVGQ